jgi:hypothetical protein
VTASRDAHHGVRLPLARAGGSSRGRREVCGRCDIRAAAFRRQDCRRLRCGGQSRSSEQSGFVGAQGDSAHLDGAGHIAHMEQPKAVIPAIKDGSAPPDAEGCASSERAVVGKCDVGHNGGDEKVVRT